jgi:hypothetical protein
MRAAASISRRSGAVRAGCGQRARARARPARGASRAMTEVIVDLLHETVARCRARARPDPRLRETRALLACTSGGGIERAAGVDSLLRHRAPITASVCGPACRSSRRADRRPRRTVRWRLAWQARGVRGPPARCLARPR